MRIEPTDAEVEAVAGRMGRFLMSWQDAIQRDDADLAQPAFHRLLARAAIIALDEVRGR